MGVAIKAVLPIPPTSNHAYANTPKGRVKTVEARAYAKYVGDSLLTQGYVRMHGDELRDKPLALLAIFYFARKGKVDLANREKLMVDAMFKHLGLDDSLIVFMQLTKRYDKHGARCEVILRPATEEER